ncbi:MAG: hypothetical protein R2762_06640 [Bryobacteraceae bacterium]
METADKRELRHLSTGQRAQVAVSFLTAQNMAIPHKLSHRIILLGSASFTAYDLSGRPRSDTLAINSPMAARMSETAAKSFRAITRALTVPPGTAGSSGRQRKMRLLGSLTGNRSEAQPIQALSVEATLEADPETQKALAADLENF